MGRRGNQGAFSSVANQMELKTGEMPTLAAAASKLGRNQGDINAIVRTGIARRDAPTFSGKCAYQATSTSLSGQELLVRMPLKFVESMHTMAKLTPLSGQESLARRACDSRRICTICCATENCKNTVVYVGYKTEKFTLPVLPLTVLVRYYLRGLGTLF